MFAESVAAVGLAAGLDAHAATLRAQRRAVAGTGGRMTDGRGTGSRKQDA